LTGATPQPVAAKRQHQRQPPYGVAYRFFALCFIRLPDRLLNHFFVRFFVCLLVVLLIR